MQQYNTQCGTIFAVREYKGHPAIMLRAEHKPDDWSLSSMIEPFTPGAWTADELQAQLDNWAAVKGWTSVKEDATCETETPAPTGAAAATTDGSAAVSTAETTTTSESGAGANSCETPAPDAQPNKEPPAGLAPTAPMSLPAFDYSGLPADTAEHLQDLARMRRLRLALDTAIEYGTWPDDAALDDLEVSEDAGC